MAKRMFVALDLPARITERLAGLDPRLPGLRWLPPPLQHLTLCFLASVPGENENRLIAALAEIRMPPFRLELRGLGCFCRRGQPSVIRVDLGNRSPELELLAARVRDAVRMAGLVPDEKPFHPHVTVARCKGVAGKSLKPWLDAQRNTGFGSFAVSGFSLNSSVLTPGGPEYERVFRKDFESA